MRDVEDAGRFPFQRLEVAIHIGLNQTNTIAVVANGPILDLYVNLQHIATFHNSALNSGQIGVFAFAGEASFNNARAWTL